MVKIKLRLERSAQRYLYSRSIYGFKGLMLLGNSTFMLLSFFTTTTTTATTTTTTTATTTYHLTNTRISTYRKAASNPGHVAFLILDDGKQNPHHPILEDL